MVSSTWTVFADVLCCGAAGGMADAMMPGAMAGAMAGAMPGATALQVHEPGADGDHAHRDAAKIVLFDLETTGFGRSPEVSCPSRRTPPLRAGK